MDRNMIHAASGGALVDKTPEDAKRLIANMAANSQQFGMRMDHTSKKVNEVSTSNLEKQISDLTSLVRQIAVGNMQAVKTCGICLVPGLVPGHATDMCPTLQEDELVQQANAVGNFGQQQCRYDPYSNSYNPGWRDHPNLSYGNQPMQNRYQQQRPQVNQPSSSRQNQAQNSGKLPSQSVINPKENASAILLRSGREVNNQDVKESTKKHKQGSKDSDIPEVEVNSKLNDANNFVVPPPFPSRLAKTRKEEQEKEILEMFRKVEVNIPLVDAIKQIPRYAKFLKELCTTKRKFRNNEKVTVGENVLAFIQRKLPPKCK
ncbi:uncharacterized protein LOC119370546 [Jatropha curcas]|uniref:uncharacterized protein LOC119370546 n=1 Tax=Jatropha curcas TaxID=180498 RepID=UPI0018952CA8|nr:uncharacterized protein LOC119370546 [Jatropha curcas]